MNSLLGILPISGCGNFIFPQISQSRKHIFLIPFFVKHVTWNCHPIGSINIHRVLQPLNDFFFYFTSYLSNWNCYVRFSSMKTEGCPDISPRTQLRTHVLCKFYRDLFHSLLAHIQLSERILWYLWVKCSKSTFLLDLFIFQSPQSKQQAIIYLVILWEICLSLTSMLC